MYLNPKCTCAPLCVPADACEYPSQHSEALHVEAAIMIILTDSFRLVDLLYISYLVFLITHHTCGYSFFSIRILRRLMMSQCWYTLVVGTLVLPAFAGAIPLECTPASEEPNWPTYHVMNNVTKDPVTGKLSMEKLNDVNAIFEFKGIYHVICQAGGGNWTHAVSNDLVRWYFLAHRYCLQTKSVFLSSIVLNKAHEVLIHPSTKVSSTRCTWAWGQRFDVGSLWSL